MAEERKTMVYTIKLPEGGSIDVEGPADASDDQIISFAQAELKRQRPNKRYAAPGVQRLAKTGIDNAPKAETSLPALFTQGATLGLTDEIVGGAGALFDAIQSPFRSDVDFNPQASYEAYRDRTRDSLDRTRAENPWVGNAMEIAGGVASIPAQALGKAKTLWEAVKAAPKIGGIPGAVAGFGYGEGQGSSLGGAALGGALGTAGAAAIPAFFQLGSKFYNAARDFTNPNNGIARGLVGKALEADGITPTTAATAMQEANTRGVPAMIADQGENLRNLLASVARKPGPSQRIVRETVEQRQAQQGNRVRGAIERDLGPIENPFEVSDRLLAQAREQAAPLYERAYAAPARTSPEIESLIATPAGKQALARARTIAANERRDPNAMGFDLNDQGETILTSAPSVQTLDFVKRGLDDVVEANRDPVTRRLNLDEAGRAVNDVRASFVREVDRLSPDYAAARQAYAGPASSRQALDQGRKALNYSDQEVERVTANLSDADRQQFALGLRAALAETLERRVDGADKVGALLGSPRKRRALAQVFGGEESFGRFMQTMADESLANRTYRSVSTGSQTAERLAADAGTEDASLLQDLAGSTLKGASGGMTGILAEWFNTGRDAFKFGAGKTGERAREQVAALLSETDPEALREAARKAMRDQAIRRVRSHLQLQSSIQAASAGARGIGGVSGYSLRQPE